MDIKTGNKVIIKRGKLGGQEGRVLEVVDEDVAIKLDSGALHVIKTSNLKLPAEPTITLSQLAEIVSGNVGEDRYVGVDALISEIDGLSEALERIAGE